MQPIRNAISGNLESSFDALVEAADKAWALSDDQHGSVASVDATNVPAAAVTASTPIGMASNAPARGQGQRQQGPRSGRQESKTLTLCPFHVKWGDAERRCLPSCSQWASRAPPQVFQIEEASDDNTASEN